MAKPERRSSAAPSHQEAAVIEIDDTPDSSPGLAASAPLVTPTQDKPEAETFRAQHKSGYKQPTKTPDGSSDNSTQKAKQTSPDTHSAGSAQVKQEPDSALTSPTEATQPLSIPSTGASAKADDAASPTAGVSCVDLTADSDADQREASAKADNSTSVVKSESLPDFAPGSDLELESIDSEYPDFMDLSHGTYPISESAQQSGAALQHEGVDNRDREMAAMLQEFEQNSANMPAAADHVHRNDEDSDEEDARATRNFEEVLAAYNEKCAAGSATPEDKLTFTGARLKEEQRQSLRKAKRDYAEDDLREQHEMFFPEEQQVRPRSRSASSDVFITDWATHGTELRDAELQVQDTMQGYRPASELDSPPFDEDTPKTKPAKRGRGSKSGVGASKKSSSRGKVSKPQQLSVRRGGGRGRGRGRGGKKFEPSLFDMRSLAPYDLIGAANKNASAQPQIAVKSTNRRDALAELIASVPHDAQALHVNDKKLLEDSLKQFRTSRTMKIDPATGCWKVRGMKTSLKHFQTVGVGRMRQREEGGEPHGGILADEMGLGKTVMTIANIIDGQPKGNERTKATLIIAPNAILSQWEQQLDEHAGPRYPTSVMVYRSRHKSVLGSQPAKTLGNHDVVITSYYELCHSMPKRAYPRDCRTVEAREKWWQQHYEENKGLLHQVKWHRVIIDEAQQIKNFASHTSEAAAHITAKYRWAITGTPVLNNLKEFYAYFRYLRVSNTGSFDLWSENYCKRGSANAFKRLNIMLQKFMIRRTHKDEMFGRPIISLPNVKQTDVSLEFSKIEQAVYKIVKDRFTAKIAEFNQAGAGDKQYAYIFVLMLRLRQLTGNILLIQKTMQDLLEPEDITKLWELTDTSAYESLNEADRQLLVGLQHNLRNVASNNTTSKVGTNLSSINRQTATMATSDDGGTVTERFRTYLQSLRNNGAWEKLRQALICQLCSRPSAQPYITPCGHIYCLVCVELLDTDASLPQDTRVNCYKCGNRFTKDETCPADTEIIGRRPRRAPTPTADNRRRSTSRSHGAEESVDWLALDGPVLHSTKAVATVKLLKEWFEADKTTKVLIFCQWLGLMRIFERVCKENNWDYATYNGSMENEARDGAIRRFSKDPYCRVLIAGLKSGGVGLNLPAANKVVLVDLWWNSAIETQAYCRAFRIGQKRDVEIVRLIVKDTIDVEIVDLQNKKNAQIGSVMDASNRTDRLKPQELLALFGLGGDDDKNSMVDRFLVPDEGEDFQDQESDENVDADVDADMAEMGVDLEMPDY